MDIANIFEANGERLRGGYAASADAHPLVFKLNSKETPASSISALLQLNKLHIMKYKALRIENLIYHALASWAKRQWRTE